MLVHRVRRGVRFVIWAALFWVIALVIVAIVVGDRSALMRIERAGPAIGALTLAAFVANHLLRFVRWQWMLRLLGARIPTAASFAIFMAGLGLLPTPGKIGVAARSVLLMEYGVRVRTSLAAYFAERLFDLIGLLVLAAFFYAGPLSNWFATAATIGVVVVILVARYPEPVIAALGRLVRRRARFAAAVDAIGGLLDAAKRLLALPHAIVFVFIGLVANALVGLLVYGVGMLLTTSIPVGGAIGAVAFAHLSGSASMTPGGLGSFELALLLDLEHWSMPRDNALAIVACVRFVTLWGSVLIGLPLMLSGLRRDPIEAKSIPTP